MNQRTSVTRSHCVYTHQSNEDNQPKNNDSSGHSNDCHHPIGETLVWSTGGWEGFLDVTYRRQVKRDTRDRQNY